MSKHESRAGALESRPRNPTKVGSGSVLLELSGISKSFGSVRANDAISFRLNKGEIHAVVGENGAGKTTLMNILYGIHLPDEGTIRMEGRDLAIRSPRDAIRHGIGLVSQHFLLVERHTVAENLALALPHLGFRFSAARLAAAIAPLTRQYAFSLELTKRVSQLSPGERQRVEIAKALLRGSRVLILDEPTSVLTSQEARELFAVLRRLRADGCGVIFISHKLDDVMSVSDRISVLRRGRIVHETATPEADSAALSFAMVGREIAAPTKSARLRVGGPVLRVEGLRLRVDTPGISFTVGRGEIFGIAGVAGNGQGELAEALTGLAPTRSGRIELGGRPLGGLGAARFRQAGVAHIPEDRNRMGVVPSMTLEENFALGWLDGPECRQGPLLRRRRVRERAAELLSRYRIAAPSLGTRTSLLSGGNIQRLIVAREFASRPGIIVAVHPTYGLDVQAIVQVHQAILDQAAEGAGFVLISEDLDELLALSDRIAVLYDFRLMGEVGREEAQLNQIGLWMAGRAA